MIARFMSWFMSFYKPGVTPIHNDLCSVGSASDCFAGEAVCVDAELMKQEDDHISQCHPWNMKTRTGLQQH